MNTQSMRALAITLLVIYLVVLLLLTFAPFGVTSELGGRINLEPFDTINRAFRRGPGSLGFRLMLGNIAAFVPLGLLVPIALRSRWSGVVVLLTALGLSIGIELGQLAVSRWLGFAYRSTDIDDVILNVLGAVLGFAVFAALATVRSVSMSVARR